MCLAFLVGHGELRVDLYVCSGLLLEHMATQNQCPLFSPKSNSHT
jgi:hypothetical protein